MQKTMKTLEMVRKGQEVRTQKPTPWYISKESTLGGHFQNNANRASNILYQKNKLNIHQKCFKR